MMTIELLINLLVNNQNNLLAITGKKKRQHFFCGL